MGSIQPRMLANACQAFFVSCDFTEPAVPASVILLSQTRPIADIMSEPISTTGSPADALRSQWQNPGDIFSLLLLVGGDVVQRAIARLVGVHVTFPVLHLGFYLTPVAFSFGWVAYAFMSLASVLGDHRLMPEPDTDIQIINCDNGYVRTNNSWVLGRLLRDKQACVRAFRGRQTGPTDSTGEVSLLIEIFDAKPTDISGPRPTWIWLFSCLVIVAQHGLAIAPWIRYGDWGVFLITICGTALALITAGLPQWKNEKWAAERLASDDANKVIKTMALTKGNGHQYLMLVRGYRDSWDLEQMASGRERTVPWTRLTLIVTSILWILLLITVTGLKERTWFLIGVGGIGMLENVIVSAIPCEPKEFDIELKQASRIVAYQTTRDQKKYLKNNVWPRFTEADAAAEFTIDRAEGTVRDVMGALIELEKFQRKAGAALLPVFFPGSVDYEPSLSLNNKEQKFWKYARHPPDFAPNPIQHPDHTPN